MHARRRPPRARCGSPCAAAGTSSERSGEQTVAEDASQRFDVRSPSGRDRHTLHVHCIEICTAVHFVEHGHHARSPVFRIEHLTLQRVHHRLRILPPCRSREIDDVNQEIGGAHRLKCRRERGNEVVGKISDEPHCVRHQHRPSRNQFRPPDTRIQRRKQLVLNQNIRRAQPVQQRGLAAVRVPDQGDLW